MFQQPGGGCNPTYPAEFGSMVLTGAQWDSIPISQEAGCNSDCLAAWANILDPYHPLNQWDAAPNGWAGKAKYDNRNQMPDLSGPSGMAGQTQRNMNEDVICWANAIAYRALLMARTWTV